MARAMEPLVGHRLTRAIFVVLSLACASWRAWAGLEIEWSSQINVDRIVGLQLDAQTNTFVLGSVGSAGFRLVKIDVTGHQLWAVSGLGPPQVLAVNGLGESVVCDTWWVTKYNPAGDVLWQRAIGGGVSPNAGVLDAGGNVIVGGYQVLIKWGPDGVQLWRAAAYDMVSIQLDSAGAIIVQGGNSLSKYTPEGTLVWQDFQIHPEVLALDPVGNIYAGGNKWPNLAAIKYSPEGAAAWLSLFWNPVGDVQTLDRALASGLDQGRNMYIVARATGYTYRLAPTVLKFGPDGALQWVSRTAPSIVAAAVFDPPGNSYVSVLDSPGLGALLKFDSLGTLLWGQTLTNSVGAQMGSAALTLAAEGELILAAPTWFGPTNAPAMVMRCRDVPVVGAPTIKKPPASTTFVAGTELRLVVEAEGSLPLTFHWMRNGTPLGSGTTSVLTITNVQPADAGEYVVSVGNSVGVAQSASATVVVASMPVIVQQPEATSTVIGSGFALSVATTGTSSLQYVWRYGGIPIRGVDGPVLTMENVKLSQAGDYDVVISSLAGSVTSSVAPVSVFTSYRLAWSTNVQTGLRMSASSATVLAPDGSIFAGALDNLSALTGTGGLEWALPEVPAQQLALAATNGVFAGASEYGADSYAEWRLAKVSAKGAVEWRQSFRFERPGDDWLGGLVPSPNGDLYVAGSTGGWGNQHLVMLRLDANGHQVWRADYTDTNTFNSVEAGVAMDSLGNLILAGSTGPDQNMDVLIVKYDQAGHLLWVRTFDGPAHRDDTTRGLALDADGNIVVASASIRTNGYASFMTLKYDSAGALLWAAQFTGADQDYLFPLGALIDRDGNVVVAGYVQSQPRFHYLTIKYSKAGHELWARRFSPANVPIKACAVAMDQVGSIYVTGFAGIVAYSPQGETLWSDASLPGDSVAIDRNGAVYVGYAWDFAHRVSKYEGAHLRGRLSVSLQGM